MTQMLTTLVSRLFNVRLRGLRAATSLGLECKARVLRRNFLTPPDDGGDDIFELLREIQARARLRLLSASDERAPPHLRLRGMIALLKFVYSSEKTQ